MKLLLLHGPPASGKLTIAKEISNKLKCRLFDNHVSIDLARTLFEFGTDEFWDLVKNIRFLALESAAQSNIELLIFTLCYSDDDRTSLETYEAILKKNSGELLPVYVSCSNEILRLRVIAQDRVERKKLASVEQLNSMLNHNKLIPIPRQNCLIIDSEKLIPTEAAQAIIKHFNLDVLSK